MKHPENFLYVLLNGGANVNAVDSCGMSPLETAFMVLDRSPKLWRSPRFRRKAHFLIEMLLKKGAEPNIKTRMTVRNNTGYTPLHAAVFSKKPELVKLLLTYGADRDAKNDLKETPLDIAVNGDFDNRPSAPAAHDDEVAREEIIKILTGPVGPPNGFRKNSKRIKNRRNLNLKNPENRNNLKLSTN